MSGAPLATENIDRIRQLKTEGTSNRKIQEKLATEIGRTISLSLISKHTTDMIATVGRAAKTHEQMASHLDENLDEEVKDTRWTEVDGHAVFDYKVEKQEHSISLPIPMLDNIWRDFSHKPGGGRLTGQQIIEKYKLREHDNNANRVLNLLRNRMDLNQYCDLLCPATIQNIKVNNGEKELKKVLTERVRAALRGHLDEDNAFNKIYQKEQIDRLSKIAKIHDDKKLFFKWVQEKLAVANLVVPQLPKYKPKNKNSMTVMFGDLHAGTHTHENMEKRVHKMIDDILSYEVGHIELFGIGDWFETIAKGTGTMHADQHLDMKYFGTELREKTYSLLAGMLHKLGENGTVVNFHMMFGNHDRASDNNAEDRYRMGAYPLFMLLRETVAKSNMIVTSMIDRINSITIGDINYIVGHGEKDLMKMPTEQLIMMYGNKMAKYYIIGQGHLHTYTKKDGKVTSKSDPDKADMEGYNYTKIIVPAMCDAGFYSEQVIAKRSAPGCVYILENEDCAPDIVIKRL